MTTSKRTGGSWFSKHPKPGYTAMRFQEGHLGTQLPNSPGSPRKGSPQSLFGALKGVVLTAACPRGPRGRERGAKPALHHREKISFRYLSILEILLRCFPSTSEL